MRFQCRVSLIVFSLEDDIQLVEFFLQTQHDPRNYHQSMKMCIFFKLNQILHEMFLEYNLWIEQHRTAAAGNIFSASKELCYDKHRK